MKLKVIRFYVAFFIFVAFLLLLEGLYFGSLTGAVVGFSKSYGSVFVLLGIIFVLVFAAYRVRDRRKFLKSLGSRINRGYIPIEV